MEDDNTKGEGDKVISLVERKGKKLQDNQMKRHGVWQVSKMFAQYLKGEKYIKNEDSENEKKPEAEADST